MAWVKLDDDFFSNPKIVRAGRDARDLYLAALCFCNRGLTDGIVPAEALRRLAADAEIDDWVAAADRLVAVGLWEGCPEGYRVHDYLEYQPSRERVIQTRDVRAEAGRKGGQQKASNLLEASQPVASESRKQNAAPLRTRTRPVPGNDPDPGEGAAHAAQRAREKRPPPAYTPEFETFWAECPRKEPSKAEAFAAWSKQLAAGADPAAIMAGLARFRPGWQQRIAAGEAEFVPHVTTWLNGRRWTAEPAPPAIRGSPNGYVPAAAARLVESERMRDDIAFFRREAQREDANGSTGDERNRDHVVVDAEFTAADPRPGGDAGRVVPGAG